MSTHPHIEDLIAILDTTKGVGIIGTIPTKHQYVGYKSLIYLRSSLVHLSNDTIVCTIASDTHGKLLISK